MNKNEFLTRLKFFIDSLVFSNSDYTKYLKDFFSNLNSKFSVLPDSDLPTSNLSTYYPQNKFLSDILGTLHTLYQQLGFPGLVIVCNKNKDEVNLNDFTKIKDFERAFNFLESFICKDIENNYLEQIHYSAVKLYIPVTSQTEYLAYITGVHNQFAYSKPEIFEAFIDSKGRSIVNLKNGINKEVLYNYIPTIDLTKSKIDLSKIKFDSIKPEILIRNTKLGVYSPTNLILEGKNYTFGLELETCLGKVPAEEYEDLNVSCIYDGSLKDDDGVARGGEYVTGVLVGDSGINQLRKIVHTLLKNQCKVNHRCSVHVHIGSANFNKENLISMYLLGMMLEEEFFNLFPFSRRKNAYCRHLTKIFTNPELEELAVINRKSTEEYNALIDYLFDLKLFPYVTSGTLKQSISSLTTQEQLRNSSKPDRRANKHTPHPQGPKCGYDKNMQRYCWLNFVTCLFSNKGLKAKTLEFRLHNGTLNFKKILAWLQICVAFTWFAENHKKSIFKGFYEDPKTGDKLSINLDLILKLAYPKNSEILIKYVNERKQLFLPDLEKHSEQLEYEESLNLVKSFTLKEILNTKNII